MGVFYFKKIGKKLTLDVLDSMSEDQIVQLYKLMLAAHGKTDEEIASFEKDLRTNG